MDEQLYFACMGVSHEEKVEIAIKNIQHFEAEALKFSPDGYYLCDSYGKDSCVILDLAKRAGVKFKAHHNLTTLDAPELIKFGREHHPETIISRPERSLLTILAKEKTTLPTRNRRWCCEIYKERKNGCVHILGIRAQESRRRRRSWLIWSPHYETRDWSLNPILYWSDENVWKYIHDNKIPYCSLYDEGFTRLGCIGCPMANDRRKEFNRWPGYEKAWRRAIGKFWERMQTARRKDGDEYSWKRFKSADELWSWWMEEMPKDENDECQMGLF